ncbi:MAG: hypothetical protein ABSD63_03875 [Candidatus Korobacteraceae bacterium]|jgi:hypothetical protein
MRKIACFIVVILIGTGTWAYGQDQKDTLQQKLNSQFALTQIAHDRSDIVSAGARLQLQRGGLMMYSVASPFPPVNTYKNGKILQGSGGFGRDLLITMAAPGNGTASNYPHRQFAADETLWVTKVEVQKSGIVFRLYSDPYDGIHYYGDLKIAFEKGPFPTPDQALAKVSEVLIVQPGDTSGSNTALAQDKQAGQVNPQSPPVQLKLPAVYVSSQTAADQLQLNADKSFSLQEGGQPYHGTFNENGDRLELNINEMGTTTIVTLQGSNLTDSSGHTWVLREQAPPTMPSGELLKNQDVIKMVKAGFDDGTILAKIGSSRCQFDTSTDALIQLKKNGVSAPVIKAMISAEK